jgi:hypothetical protein
MLTSEWLEVDELLGKREEMLGLECLLRGMATAETAKRIRAQHSFVRCESRKYILSRPVNQG